MYKKIILPFLLCIMGFLVPIIGFVTSNIATSKDYSVFAQESQEGIVSIEESITFEKSAYISTTLAGLMVAIAVCLCASLVTVRMFKNRVQDRKYYIPAGFILLGNIFCTVIWIIYAMSLLNEEKARYYYLSMIGGGDITSNIANLGLRINIIILITTLIICGCIFVRRKTREYSFSKKLLSILDILCCLAPLIILFTDSMSLMMGSPTVCCMPDNYEALYLQAQKARLFYINITWIGFSIYTVVVLILFVAILDFVFFELINAKRWQDGLKYYILPVVLSACDMAGLFLWRSKIVLLEGNFEEYFIYPPGDSVTNDVAFLSILLIVCVLIVATVIFGGRKLVKNIKSKKS